jgi:carboxyl-terminal processing protease
MRPTRSGTAACCLAALLLGCGGGGGSGGGSGGGTAAPAPTPSPVATPAPTPSPATAQCSLRARQDWALAQLQEWYLFPNLLDVAVNPAAHATVQAYIDALVAPARAQNRDRYFTYLTSIAEENAYYEEGATAGFGFRLSYTSSSVTITETFEGAPALAAGIRRGEQILAIGTSPSTLRNVSALIYEKGPYGVVEALGPDTAGTTRVLRVGNPAGATRDIMLTKTVFALDPVSDRYGAKLIVEGTRRVGYLNLRTFIDTAEPDLRSAFANFKAQGVTELIVDLRYNGGGLISIAELLGNLMAAGRGGQVFEYVTFRDSKADENETYRFEEQPESIAPTRVAFIVTEDTASASELVINGFLPYLGNNMALVGTNTYGKPVGQIALDQPACDDRLRAVALKIENANRQGDYFNGLARTVPVTCSALDDRLRELGDEQESMLRVALDWLENGRCFPISATTGATAAARGAGAGAPARGEALVPEVPRSTFEREVPGAY